LTVSRVSLRGRGDPRLWRSGGGGHVRVGSGQWKRARHCRPAANAAEGSRRAVNSAYCRNSFP
jgi:hypothetical protein